MLGTSGMETRRPMHLSKAPRLGVCVFIPVNRSLPDCLLGRAVCKDLI